jgi:hypothetical protein
MRGMALHKKIIASWAWCAAKTEMKKLLAD